MTRNSGLKLPEAALNIGRPTKFTPERREAIIGAISRRVPYEFAAEANGICEDTLYDWLNTARVHRMQEIDSDYTRFSEDIKRAEMEKILYSSDMVAAQPERWQAHAWLLERRWPKHYGPNSQLNELNKRLAQLEGGGSKNEEASEEY